MDLFRSACAAVQHSAAPDKTLQAYLFFCQNLAEHHKLALAFRCIAQRVGNMQDSGHVAECLGWRKLRNATQGAIMASEKVGEAKPCLAGAAGSR